MCGHSPIITNKSLDKGNGHGFPGNYDYHIRCSNAECPLSKDITIFCVDDINRSKEEAYEYLGQVWNEETVRINELILHRGNDGR